MAERQETSVMASIQDLLRDHAKAEEQEKVLAQQRAEAEEKARVDALRREHEDAEARLRAEDEARQAKVFEEQRRQAELTAMQEATVQRARMEAEAQARLAEMTARQAHEQQLHAIQHDKSKKTLKWVAIGSGIVLFFALILGGFALKSSHDKAVAAEAEANRLRDQMAQAEQDRAKLQADLNGAKDPETIARLQAQLAQQDQKINQLNTDMKAKGGTARPAGGGPAVGAPGVAPPPAQKKCNCREGDPICTCL